MKNSTKGGIKFAIGLIVLLGQIGQGGLGFVAGSGGEVIGYNAWQLFAWIGGAALIVWGIRDLRRKDEVADK